MRAEERTLLKCFIPPFLLVALMWLVKGYEIRYGVDLYEYGIFPRDIDTLKGILTMPFIHADLTHIFSNSIPLIILGACMIFFYRDMYKKVFALIWLLSGSWLWLGGREAWHIGASGVVYGMASFLLISGILRKERRLMALSLLVIFLYGGMVWGFFPLLKGISWEAHLFGAIAGCMLAWVYRKEGPQRVAFDWENEPDSSDEMIDILEEENGEEENNNQPTSTDPFHPPTITYHYKTDDPEKDESLNNK